MDRNRFTVVVDVLFIVVNDGCRRYCSIGLMWLGVRMHWVRIAHYYTGYLLLVAGVDWLPMLIVITVVVAAVVIV